ncbi:MAG: hypothetical protein MH219_08970 [Marinobacter sp.]|nr:hypothetical protein [Marinobacter sp.]
MLDNILYDWWLTPDIWRSDDIKTQAVNQILPTFQSWRDFEETILRMNPEGIARPAEFQKNLDRLFEFIGKGKKGSATFCPPIKKTRLRYPEAR